jgi:hypothetical protein
MNLEARFRSASDAHCLGLPRRTAWSPSGEGVSYSGTREQETST